MTDANEEKEKLNDFNSLTEKEREEMRKELNTYLLECRLDSEGKPLVHVPPNFQQVVEAMNRDDLFSVEEKPWSKYLLQSSVSSDKLFAGDLESSSRYKDVINEDEPDRKIKKGLAEIYMLDRQLQDVSQREKRSSTNKVTMDRTFLTKALQDSDSISEPTSSARQPSASVLPLEKSTIEQPDNRAKKGSSSSDSKPKISGLSAEEELRVKRLLDEGEDETYGLAEYKEKNEAIDQLLSQFGRLDRLKSSAGGDKEFFVGRKRNLINNSRPEEEEEEGESDKRDYLTEQRQERLQKESLRKVDKMLRVCTQQRIHFDGLLGLAGKDSRPTKSNLVDKVPQYDEVELEKTITRADITALVRSIVESEDASNSAVKTSAPTAEHINALLDRYRVDISDLKAKRDAIQNRAFMQQLDQQRHSNSQVNGEVPEEHASRIRDEEVDDDEEEESDEGHEIGRWLYADHLIAHNNSVGRKALMKKPPSQENNHVVRDDYLSGISNSSILSIPQQQQLQQAQEVLSQVLPRQIDLVVPDAPSNPNPVSSLPPMPSTALLSQRTSSSSDGIIDLFPGEAGRPKSKERQDLRNSAPITVFRATYKKDNYTSGRTVNVTQSHIKIQNITPSNSNAAALSAAMMGSQPRYGLSHKNNTNIDSAAAAVSALLKERQVQNILNKS